MNGRGPDPAELALDAFKRELLRFRELGAKTLRAADDLLKARAELTRTAGVEIHIDAERELRALLQMRDDVPFWHRPVPEPLERKAVAR